MPRSETRTPRTLVLADGVPLAGVLSIDIASNNHNAADRFTIALALADNPALRSGAATLSIDAQCSLDGSGFTSLITGTVDVLSIDPIRGLIRLEGRDRTAGLIDARTQETFANRTSSEIATLLAQRHGLSVSIMPTTTLVGRYYQADHDRITLDAFSRATTEWDLLTALAGHEGFDVFVVGDTLHFEPPAPNPTPLALTPNDCIDLRLERALTLARDIEVTVKSWNSKQQTAFAQTVRATHGGGGAGGTGGKPQTYVYVVPNLTPSAALALAQRRLAELSAHERVVVLTIPGELAITPRATIALGGTGTDFDQTYFVDRIDRRLGLREGFTQTVRAKNVSPASQATTPADQVTGIVGL